MTTFGVHSEVGRLRQVMVHRPELSLQRLTPSNHDELLFDDVLWVERAQYEHDQFVARMRERGVEVFLLQTLLAEALEASDEGRQRLIEVAASEYTVGLSLVDEIRAALADMKPEVLATHLIGGLTVAESGLDVAALPGQLPPGRCPGRPEHVRAAAAAQHPLHPGLVVLDLRRESRSTRCSGRPGGSRPTTSRRSTATTRCSPTRTSSTGTRTCGDDGRFDAHDFGRSSLEGGDVQPIGNGTVLIGMSERSQARMIEQVAAALFEKGAAERVIAVVMTKDRAHMHLDTVFTMLDRDKVTAYPKVVDGVRAISLRPGSNGQRFHVTEEKSFLGAVADAMGVPRMHVVETGGDAYQQEREQWDDGNNVVALEPGRRRGLRAQHLHDREDARGRRRGDHDRGVRARQGPRRWSLHDLPADPRPGVTGQVAMFSRDAAVVLRRRAAGLRGRHARVGARDTSTTTASTSARSARCTAPP